MQMRCQSSYMLLAPCFESIKQGFSTAILTLNEVRRDPEGLQRICLVALSAIQGINFYTNKNYLPSLVHVLDIANSFDFYGFLKIPYYLYHAIDTDKIDESQILNSLENILCQNWKVGEKDQTGSFHDSAVRAFAQKCVNGLLGQMHENDWAYQDSSRFKQALQNWLIEELRLTSYEQNNAWKAAHIDLSLLLIIQKKDSWIETLTNVAFIGVDILCIPAFLQEWNLIDLTAYANRVGQYSLFKWVPNQKVEEWLRAGLCLGFLLRFLEAARCLCEKDLGQITKVRAKWSLVVSAAELVFNFSHLCHAKLRVVIGLTFIAKSIGIMSMIHQSRMQSLKKE